MVYAMNTSAPSEVTTLIVVFCSIHWLQNRNKVCCFLLVLSLLCTVY